MSRPTTDVITPSHSGPNHNGYMEWPRHTEEQLAGLSEAELMRLAAVKTTRLFRYRDTALLPTRTAGDSNRYRAIVPFEDPGFPNEDYISYAGVVDHGHGAFYMEIVDVGVDWPVRDIIYQIMVDPHSQSVIMRARTPDGDFLQEQPRQTPLGDERDALLDAHHVLDALHGAQDWDDLGEGPYREFIDQDLSASGRHYDPLSR